jgi:hypothetical protein
VSDLRPGLVSSCGIRGHLVLRLVATAVETSLRRYETIR